MSDSTAVWPDSLSFRLPESWEYMPVEPGAFQAWRAKNIKAAERAGLARSQIRQLELLLTKSHHDLHEGQAIAAAGLVQAVQSTKHASEESKPELLLAACTLSIHTREDLGSPVPLHAEYLLEAMSQPKAKNGERVSNVEAPKLVEIPAGQALRLLRLRRSSDVQSGLPEVFAQSYLVPIADGDAMAVMAFLTPTLRQARPLAEVFQMIAQTLTAYLPSEPTLRTT